MLRFWACFAFLVAYDAYAAWLFSWIPATASARRVAVVPPPPAWGTSTWPSSAGCSGFSCLVGRGPRCHLLGAGGRARPRG